MHKMFNFNRILVSCFVIYQWCIPTLCYTQPVKTDTAFLAISKKKSVELYARSIQSQSRLYNGSEYIIYQPNDEEHPYFTVDDWSYGSIVYENELYENVPLLYDISIDKVITESNGGNPIKLSSEKIQRFSLLDHTFIKVKSDSTNKITEGFYDQFYDGTTKVCAKHTKAYQESLEQGQVIPRFDESVQYYLVKNGIFYTVKTKGSVLQVFRDRKQDVKDFIKKNRIRFKTNREEAIVRIAKFYDTLNH